MQFVSLGAANLGTAWNLPTKLTAPRRESPDHPWHNVCLVLKMEVTGWSAVDALGSAVFSHWKLAGWAPIGLFLQQMQAPRIDRRLYRGR